MTWYIRPATVADLDRIIALEQALPELPHWSREQYARLLWSEGSTTRHLLLVAYGSDGVIGFAAAVFALAPICMAELETLGVEPAMRRLGVGRALCKEVLQWCQIQGASALELEVRSSSLGAINLYKDLGLASVGRRPNYYLNPLDDAVLMSLPL